jgi:hypothetical protein
MWLKPGCEKHIGEVDVVPWMMTDDDDAIG